MNFFRALIYINAFNRMEISLLFQCDVFLFFKRIYIYIYIYILVREKN